MLTMLWNFLIGTVGIPRWVILCFIFAMCELIGALVRQCDKKPNTADEANKSPSNPSAAEQKPSDLQQHGD